MLADASTEGAPTDKFKLEHVPQKLKNSVTPKVNHVLHCAPEDLVAHSQHIRAYQPKQRWSEINKDMQQGSDRYLDLVFNRAE